MIEDLERRYKTWATRALISLLSILINLILAFVMGLLLGRYWGTAFLLFTGVSVLCLFVCKVNLSWLGDHIEAQQQEKKDRPIRELQDLINWLEDK